MHYTSALLAVLLIGASSVALAQATKEKEPAAGPTPGKYTCTFFAGTLQNVPGFTLQDGGSFTDHKGSGTWTFANGIVSFSGSAWNGQRAKNIGAGKLRVLKENGGLGAVTCSLSKK